MILFERKRERKIGMAYGLKHSILSLGACESSRKSDEVALSCSQLALILGYATKKLSKYFQEFSFFHPNPLDKGATQYGLAQKTTIIFDILDILAQAEVNIQLLEVMMAAQLMELETTNKNEQLFLASSIHRKQTCNRTKC